MLISVNPTLSATNYLYEEITRLLIICIHTATPVLKPIINLSLSTIAISYAQIVLIPA